MESLAGRPLRALPLRSPPVSELGASRLKLPGPSRGSLKAAGGAGPPWNCPPRAVEGCSWPGGGLSLSLSLPGRVVPPALPEAASIPCAAPAPPRSPASFVSFRLRGGNRPNCHVVQRIVDLEHIKPPHLSFRGGSRSFPRGASWGERRGCRTPDRGRVGGGRAGVSGPDPAALGPASSSGPPPSSRVPPASSEGHGRRGEAGAARLPRVSRGRPARFPALVRGGRRGVERQGRPTPGSLVGGGCPGSSLGTPAWFRLGVRGGPCRSLFHGAPLGSFARGASECVRTRVAFPHAGLGRNPAAGAGGRGGLKLRALPREQPGRGASPVRVRLPLGLLLRGRRAGSSSAGRCPLLACRSA